MLETINQIVRSAARFQSGTIEPRELSFDEIFAILDLVPTPILVALDPLCNDIRSNTAGRALFVSNPSQNLSQSAPEAERPDFLVYSDEEIVPFHKLPMQQSALTAQPVYGSECELRFNSGLVKYISGNALPLFDSDGVVRGSIGVFLDVTDRKRLEQQNKLMAAEIKHRAKNSLMVVDAVAAQTIKPLLPKTDYEKFQGRLQSLGRALDISLPDQASAEIAAVVETSLARQLGDDSSRVMRSGPDLVLPPESVIALSMSLHELITNACKYGALSVLEGYVTVTWERASEDSADVKVTWVERGGPPVTPPSRRGFGSKLLGLLGSTPRQRVITSYDPDGFVCHLFASLVDTSPARRSA